VGFTLIIFTGSKDFRLFRSQDLPLWLRAWVLIGPYFLELDLIPPVRLILPSAWPDSDRPVRGRQMNWSSISSDWLAGWR
jgi:hypothetical protein